MYLREAGLQLLYNGAEMNFAASFGASEKGFESNAVFLDEEEDLTRATLAYISSEQLTTYRLHSHEQDLLPRDSPGHVTFLSSLRKKEGLIYVLAEHYEDASPDLVLLQAANRKVVRVTHSNLMHGAAIRQVRMPKDAIGAKNVCVTLSDEPATLTAWRIDKQKLLVEKPAKVANVCFDQCPENPLQFVLAGNKYLKLWDINPQEGTMDETALHLVSLKFERDNDFLDLRFVPYSTTLLVLVSGNRLIIFENYEQTRLISDLFNPKVPGMGPKISGEFEVKYNQITGRETVDSTKGERLIALPKGFCVGGSGGFLAVYEADEGHPPSHVTTTRMPSTVSHILSGSVSSDGNFLLLSCSQLDSDPPDNPLRPITTSIQESPGLKIDFYIANMKKMENELPDAISMLFPASQHFGPVRDVAVSIGKNQIVTVGKDQHLRIWHKNGQWTGVVDQKLQESPLAVAVHPSGAQLAIGLKEAFKVYAVLESELVSELDHVVKSCFAVSYSPSGKYLASNSAGTITVFSPYTLRVVSTLSGHFSTVHSLTWDPFDLTLTSACYGGTVVVWDITKAEQRAATVPRQGKIVSAFYDEGLDLFAVLTNDGVVRVIGDAGATVVELPANGHSHSSMLVSLSLGMMFLGTTTGVLRVTLWPVLPNTDIDKPGIDFQEVHLHSDSILKIAVSEFYDSLTTVSNDSTVLVQTLVLLQNGERLRPNSLIGLETGGGLHATQQGEGPVTNSLALVRRNAIEVYEMKIKDLEDSISTLKSQHKYALETRDHQHFEEQDRTKREYEDKLKFEQDYSASLKREIDTKAADFAGKLQAMEVRQQMQLEQELRKHETIQAEDQERYDLLKEETEDLRRRMSHEVANLLSMHKEVKSSIETECRTRLEEVKSAYEDLLEAMRAQGERYETGLMMTEKEYEDELISEKDKLERQLEDERERVKSLKLVNTRLNAERDNIAKREEAVLKELQILKEANQQGKSEVEEFKTRIAKMQEQITEREDVIKKKENAIKELRSFNIHLQNFRFVLDQKIKSLKDDRGPLGEQLISLQEHIRSMYAELLEEFEKTRACMKQVSDLQSRNKSLLEQHKSMRNRVLLAKRKVALIQSDLVNLVRITNKDTLLVGLRQMIDKHLDMDDIAGSGDEDQEVTSIEEANLAKVRTEVMSQHDQMKEQLLSVQKRSKALENKKNSEMHRKMQENATLIQECNSLRDQLRALQRENIGLKDRITKLKSQLKDQIASELTGEPKPQASTDTLRGRAPLDLTKSKTRLVKTVSRPNFQLNSLICELEKNRSEIMEQNSQFKKMQEQVSSFLAISPRSRVEQSTEIPSLRGQGMLSQSTTVPTVHSSIEVESFQHKPDGSPEQSAVKQEAV